MKLLVTGGSGFVGRSLCALAERRGWEVCTLSRTASPHGRWIATDLTRPLILDFTPDVVVHAAARASPWGRRREFTAQNVSATRNVVEYCERNGTPHLVYISSSAVLYRNEHQLAMDEETPVPARFLNDYARTKYEGEKIVGRYSGTHAILRPRAVFGEGDTVVFPRLLRAAKEGRFPIIASPQPVLADLIHIETLCDYILAACTTRAGGLFHLSNHQPVEIVPFLVALFARLGLPAPTRRIPVAKAMLAATALEGCFRLLPFLGEPPITRFGVSVFAFSKTMNVQKSLRAWGPPSVSLEEGVERFIRWQRQHL